MPGNGLAKLRTFVLRSLAVAAVVLTYAVGTIGTQVAGLVGVSTLALVTSATPAAAQWRRRRVIVRRPFVRRRVIVRRPFVRRRYWRRWR